MPPPRLSSSRVMVSSRRDGLLPADRCGRQSGGQQPGAGFLEGVVAALCARVRVSSLGPRTAARESRTAWTAAVQRAVRSPSSRSAPPRVAANRTARSSNPSSSLSAVALRRRCSSAIPARPGRPRPWPRPQRQRSSASAALLRCSPGRRLVQSVICRAHDSDTSASAASAAATRGGPAGRASGRRGRPAARQVARACQVSHTRGDRWPSPASPPPGTVNAASTWRAPRPAGSGDPATASARRQSACRPAGQSAASARARYSSPARRNASACTGSAACTPSPQDEALLSAELPSPVAGGRSDA